VGARRACLTLTPKLARCPKMVLLPDSFPVSFEPALLKKLRGSVPGLGWPSSGGQSPELAGAVFRCSRDHASVPRIPSLLGQQRFWDSTLG
jgi:hypothetical protein